MKALLFKVTAAALSTQVKTYGFTSWFLQVLGYPICARTLPKTQDEISPHLKLGGTLKAPKMIFDLGALYHIRGNHKLPRSAAWARISSLHSSFHFLFRYPCITSIYDIPRPSSYPLLGPKYPLLGTIYPQLRVQGRSW